MNKSADIQINCAHTDDLPEILEVRYDALYESACEFYSSREVKLLLQDAGIEELRYMINKSLLFKAVHTDGTIVGSAGHYKGHLRHLYVRPDLQGYGIGKKLLNYTEQHFIKTSNTSVLQLGSALCSSGFYQKNGYTLVEETQDWDGSHYIKFEKKLA